MNNKTDTIRHLNDEFRSGQSTTGNVMITAGIQALGNVAVAIICQTVAEFNDFTQDNDPHKEHDFGAFDFEGQRIFWKIDYYDLSLTKGSQNPADPSVTTRVLTIMLAEEY
jgi:hypothetical protein